MSGWEIPIKIKRGPLPGAVPSADAGKGPALSQKNEEYPSLRNEGKKNVEESQPTTQKQNSTGNQAPHEKQGQKPVQQPVQQKEQGEKPSEETKSKVDVKSKEETKQPEQTKPKEFNSRSLYGLGPQISQNTQPQHQYQNQYQQNQQQQRPFKQNYQGNSYQGGNNYQQGNNYQNNYQNNSNQQRQQQNDRRPNDSRPNDNRVPHKSFSNTKPDPRRFENYKETANGKGFTIEGSDRVYEFDYHGGWYDEFDNYYNADGEPSTPPSDDYEDTYYEKDYGRKPNFLNEYDIEGEDEYDNDYYGDYDNVYANQENETRLADYLEDQYVQLEFTNISYRTQMRNFLDLLKRKNIEYIKEEYEVFGRSGHKGKCVVTVESKAIARKAFSLNGERLDDRNIKVLVLKPEQENEDDDNVEL